MANGIIPDKLHDFNVYSNANKLIGISGEVKLPELAAMSETLSGPGIMGEIDSPTPGFFSGMEQEIPFRALYEDMFSLMSPLDAVDITLRGAIQTIDTNNHRDDVGVRVVERGQFKKFTPGTMQQGKAMDATLTLETTYILVEYDGKEMLSNPVYTRRVAWGKRRTEKVPGKDNEYRLVKQDEYILSEVISHEAFVSKEDFDKVQEIKAIRGKKGNHNIGQYNAHLLSGIVKCPQCGAPMYIGMTKWTNQDGTERRTESYVCSYATKHRGTSVCRRNGVVASQVEDEVMEYTRKIVRNPQFIKDLQEKVMAAVDMTEVENDITAYKKQQSALQRSRDSLEQDIDRIAPDDKYAERRRADMTRRLNAPYDQNYKAEDLLQESLMKKATLESEQMSVQSMIGILSPFDAIYDRMNAAERRDLVKYLISEVELFPREEQKTQKRFVKAIAYKFPIEQKVLTQFDECGASVETVCLLVK